MAYPCHPLPIDNKIARNPVWSENDIMDNRPLVTSFASALDTDDAQSSAVERPKPPQRVRRQGPPSKRHLSLARNLQRDVWKVTDADARARRIEDTYGLQDK